MNFIAFEDIKLSSIDDQNPDMSYALTTPPRKYFILINYVDQAKGKCEGQSLN